MDFNSNIFESAFLKSGSMFPPFTLPPVFLSVQVCAQDDLIMVSSFIIPLFVGFTSVQVCRSPFNFLFLEQVSSGKKGSKLARRLAL